MRSKAEGGLTLVHICWLLLGIAQGRVVFRTTPTFPRTHRGAKAGEVICVVTAYDADSKEELTQYKLARLPDTLFFTIDEDTGVITTSGQPIRKAVGEAYSLRVYGVLGQFTYDMAVTITVSTKNSFAPEFERTDYTFFVDRRARPPSIVGQVSAEDRDVDNFNRNVQYSASDTALFWVDRTTGVIKVNGPLPPNFQEVTFMVSASDRGVPPLVGYTTVNIRGTALPVPTEFCNSMLSGHGTVCWKIPDIAGWYEGFRFRYGPESEGINSEATVLSESIVGDEACVTLDRLVPGVTYVFHVSTNNGTDESQRSVEGRFKADNSEQEFLLVGSNCSAFNVCNLVQPCANGGDCVWKEELKFSCNCADGWKGKNCLIKDLCWPNPCLNSATCISISSEQYQCQCEDGFYGDSCKFRDPCRQDTCLNGGLCLRESDGGYSCNCTQTYTGRNCQEFDPCQLQPCEHGTCSRNSSAVNGFTCDCHEGYTGTLCVVSNQCIVNPVVCENRGTCIYLDNGSYKCTCPSEYTGQHCESFNACSLNICGHNSTCIYLPNNRYRCSCLDGYYGQECQHYNKCTNRPCLNGGTCTNTTESFTCDCLDAYSGKTCEVFDPCFGNPCERGGSCNVISSTDFSCTCSPETFGKTCLHVNSCKLGFCKNGASCENTTLEGAFICHCATGYYGIYCEDFNPCSTTPCLHGGTCYNRSSVEYNCSCLEGYTGKTCADPDPCVSNPCFNNGRCIGLSSQSYRCSCHSGFSGNQCQFYDFCTSEPCGRGGSCQLTYGSSDVSFVGEEDTPFRNVSNFFKCVCTEDYTGVLCESALGACLSEPCYHGATCVLGETDFVCVCSVGYTGVTCETKMPEPPCFAKPCQHGGTCREQGQDFVCDCGVGYRGKVCGEEVRCPNEQTKDGSGTYRWPSTAYGVRGYLSCAIGPPGKLASRRCGLDGGTILWEAPDTSNCTKKDESYATAQLAMLKSLTSDPDNMGPDDVAQVADVLEFVFEFSLKNTKIANDLTEVVSNVMEVRESVLKVSQENNKCSERMVEMIGNYTSQAEIDSGQNVTLVTNNINVVALDVGDERGNKSFSPAFLDKNNASEASDATISLPPNLLQSAFLATHHPSQRLEFAAFKTARLFLDESTEGSSDTVVVSASVFGQRVENLSDPVIISLPMNVANRNYTCKFWNVTEERWSTNGVATADSRGNITECHAYHLTSFAILMDPSPDFHVDPIHDTIQTYITYIGCGVSMLGLAITVITFAMFKCLHGDKSGKILLNLCVSLLLLNIVFLLGSQQSSEYGREVCMAVAVLIHYFLLTSLMWMCIEAGNMYRVLVTVFTRYTSYFMLKRCVAAWGIPAVIVAITLGVSLSNYETRDEFCFISHANVTAFYVALLAPACLIILIDIVVFVMVSRVIMKPRFTGHINAQDTTITAAQVRGAFAVMVLLGVAWVFGPLAINEAKVVFSYIFCIANAFQGFLIFVFRCFINPEARAAWVQLIKTGTFKRKRGPSVPTTSSTASKGDSKANGMLDDSKRNTMVLNENGWHSDKYVHRSDWANLNDHGKLNGHSKTVNGNGKLSDVHTNGALKPRTNPTEFDRL